MQIIKTTTKTTWVKSNGRSADITMANVVYNCNLNCSYCYMRRHAEYGWIKAYINWKEIVDETLEWVEQQPWPKKPNQVGSKYYWIDVGNATELPTVFKYQDWESIFERLLSNPKVGITFASTYPLANAEKWLSLGRKDRTRVRLTLMPQKYSTVLEPDTPTIQQRIAFLQQYSTLLENWQVHYSFAPIIYAKDWEKQYVQLFKQLPNNTKHKAECIFLTTTEAQRGQQYLFPEELLEIKQSTHGGKVYRYQWQIKNFFKRRFLKLMAQHLSDVEVRYIF